MNDESAGMSGIGSLRAIACRSARRAPMLEVFHAYLDPSLGLQGDFKGRKYPKRQVTLLSAEAWQEALAALGAGELPWTARRANLLVSGLTLPKARGAVLQVGPAVLEVTGQTYPCRRMDEAWAGLLRALAADWRGGLTCRVLKGGAITLGDPISVVHSPPDERPPRLP